MAPPPKTYLADLEASLKAARNAGVDIDVIPGLLRPSGTDIGLFRDYAFAQQTPCKPCTEKGIVCRATNLNRFCCYNCIWGQNCTWQKFMKDKRHSAGPKCHGYEKAREAGLRALPDGAVWGGRAEQPKHLCQGIVLKKEKGASQMVAADGEGERSARDDVVDKQILLPQGDSPIPPIASTSGVDQDDEDREVSVDVKLNIMYTKLHEIDKKLDRLLRVKREPEDESPLDTDTEPLVSQQKAKRTRTSTSAVAGPSGMRHSDDGDD
ncbi:hypothetical protein C8T65DRAFT_738479 [Cerioporus squamosus]|nr:hypothetical protein C8T65DRAFT_738479 [Cerioporus squamosus]